jgi:hypothetical protein
MGTTASVTDARFVGNVDGTTPKVTGARHFLDAGDVVPKLITVNSDVEGDSARSR